MMEYMPNVRKNHIIIQISMIRETLFSLSIFVCHRRGLLHLFQQLCHQFTQLITQFTELCKNGNTEVVFKETVLVHLQLQVKFLSFFINIFVKEAECKLILSEVRKFCKSQMLDSLDQIEEALKGNFNQEYNKGNFIKWIDSALKMMNEIDYINKKQEAKITFYDSKVLFEEVLSHAMTIAQVTLPDDYQKIRGSGQSVIEALECLTNEFNKPIPNIPMLNLFIDSCTTKLITLENKVNTAVLKLCLKVFSEYTLPLENLQTFSFKPISNGSEEEFNHLVMDFDIHVDRIIQIALFAVACSYHGSNRIKIKSCLACLEGMETELIPAFATVFKGLAGNGYQAMLLRNLWLSQAKQLLKAICLIIDPFAFCEVIYEENKTLVDELCESVKGGSVIQPSNFTKLMRQSKVLEDFIEIILKNGHESNADEITEALIDFQNVLKEVQSAYDMLPNDKYGRRRIIKRCKILVTAIKTISNCFLEEETQGTYDLTAAEESLKSKEDPSNDADKQVLKDITNNWSGTVGDATFRVPMSDTACSKNDLQQSMQSFNFTGLRNKFINESRNYKRSTEIQMSDILLELNNLTNVSLIGNENVL